MDVQLKRGLLESCVLAALCRGDSYGYQLIRDISGAIEISESTLYPILKRLEANQLLDVYSVEHNGRLRKYYRITQNGRLKLKEFINDFTGVIAAYEFIKNESEEQTENEQI